MPETINSIIKASSLPLSIIIIGVGNEEFKEMEQLDCDDGLLSNGFNKAKRDIVQFVPFRKYLGKPSFYLAKEVLSEIPHNVEEYMSFKNIKPNGGI
jgi:hypothetical protein